MTRRKKGILVLILIIVTSSLIGGYYGIISSHSSNLAACPQLFATVKYANATGFTHVVHPSQGYTELVLPPNSSGQVDVTYSSNIRNLTAGMFSSNVKSYHENSSANPPTFYESANVLVSPSRVLNDTSSLVEVRYIITTGPSTGLYWIAFPQSCRSAFINVGDSPYADQLP